jgi:hypothetical protein
MNVSNKYKLIYEIMENLLREIIFNDGISL